MNGKDWKVSGLCRGGKRKWHKSREISQTYSNRDEHRKPYQGNEIRTKLKNFTSNFPGIVSLYLYAHLLIY